MSDWRAGFQTHAVKYAVIVMAVANCAGIYLAHDRLSRPYAGPAAGSADAPVEIVDAAAMMTVPALEDAAPTLGIVAGPPPSALALSDGLPEIAPLPPLKVEAAPVIPSVPARAARLGRMSEPRAAARFRPAREQTDRGFDSAFTPNYAALTPYDGTSEASSLSDIHPELTAASAADAPAEDIAVSSLAETSPVDTPVAASAGDAPAAEMAAPAPAELPAAGPEAAVELPTG